MRSRDALWVRRCQLETMQADMLARVERDDWCGGAQVDYELDMMHCRLADIETELTEVEELLK